MKSKTRFALMATVGLAAGLLVVVGRLSPLTAMPVTVLSVILLFCLLPASRNLSRRFLLLGAVMIGWVPILWWLPLSPAVDRMGVSLGIALVVAFALLGLGNSVLAAVKRALPRPRTADLLLPAFGVAALWYYAPFIFGTNTSRTLTVIMKSGWDHVAHFNMVDSIARLGSVAATTQQSTDGSLWAFYNYPKHFHGLVVGLVQLVRGPDGVSHGVSLHDYAQSTGILMALVALLIVAGITQLSPSRRSLVWVMPLATLAAGAFIFGPGSVSFSTGFPNFVLACAATGLIAAIAVAMPRVYMPWHLAAVVGLIVATSHTWLLLVPAAIAAGSVLLAPYRRARWKASLPVMIVSVSIVVAGVLASLYAVWIALPSLSGETLEAGGAEAFPVGMTVLILATTLGLASLALASRAMGSTSLRGGLLGLVPVINVILLVAIGYSQMTSSGELLYYFGKLASGALLSGLVVLSVIAVVILKRSRVQRVSSGRIRWFRGLAAVFLSVAALQPFGYVGPTFGSALKEQASGLVYRNAAVALTAGESGEALRLLQAADVASEAPFGDTIYVAVLPGDVTPHLANQWSLALSRGWSVNADKLSPLAESIATTYGGGLPAFADALTDALRGNDQLRIVLAPEVSEAVLPLIDGQFHERILTW